jgi:hypothetical protein
MLQAIKGTVLATAVLRKPEKGTGVSRVFPVLLVSGSGQALSQSVRNILSTYQTSSCVQQRNP